MVSAAIKCLKDEEKEVKELLIRWRRDTSLLANLALC